MFRIDNTLISEELISKAFVCDLQKCKGICCVDGDSGPPIDRNECHIIRYNLPFIKPYMRDQARSYIEKNGFREYDEDGDLVLKCLNDGACIFAVKEGDTWACAVEKAWADGKQSFRKPVSCHLYPVRTSELGTFTAVNYQYRNICAPACKLGSSLQIPVYHFAKEALIRKFGLKWYEKLELIANSASARPECH